ncbi:MAG: hypothetical protein CMH56_05200 [Myxococcales bacterium]|nr:hypothetical protein [Myxococcales bacterium]
MILPFTKLLTFVLLAFGTPQLLHATTYAYPEGEACATDDDCGVCETSGYSFRQWSGICVEGSCDCVPDKSQLLEGCGSTPGDANEDQNTDILDVVSIVSFILGSSDDLGCGLNADVNCDTTVSILDIVKIINTILGQDTMEGCFAIGCGGDATIHCDDCILHAGVCWAGPANIFCCDEVPYYMGYSTECRTDLNFNGSVAEGAFCSYAMCEMYGQFAEDPDEEIPENGIDDDCNPETPDGIFVYDPHGSEVALDDAHVVVTETVFDGAFKVIEKTVYGSTSNSTTSTAYDVLGNPTITTDAMNHDTIKNFDALGRPTHVLHPDGHEVTYGYQGLSQLAGYPFDESGMDYVSKTTMVDERDNVKYTYKDAMGQERQQTLGTLQPRITKTNYDALGNVTEIQDPLERNMTFTYNALGWMTQMHHPDHKGTNFYYDDMGRKTKETFYDQAYRTPLCYEYDELGRVTSKRSGDCGGSANTQPQLVYAYDDSTANGNGRLTQMATLAVVENCLRPISVVDYVYDKRGRMHSETHRVADANPQTCDADADCSGEQVCLQNPWSSGCNGLCGEALTTQAAYNTNDSIAHLSTTNGDFTTSYCYNERGLLTEIPDVLTDVAYDDNGQVLSRSFSNGVIYNYTFDERKRLTSIDGPAHHYFDRAYAYDGANNLKQEFGDETSDLWMTYTYDEHHQLTQAQYTDASPYGISDLGFTYDALGNRLTHTGFETETYDYALDDGDAEARLKTVKVDGETVSSYGHGGNGKLTSMNNQIYLVYDTWDRLSSVCLEDCSNGDYLVRFTYDAADNLVRRQTEDDTTYYFYFGNQLIGHKNTDTGWTYFTSHQDKKIARHNNDDATSYFHLDFLGSTRAISDDSGELVRRLDYKPFGGVLLQFGEADTQWQFTGGRYDDAAQSTHLGARHLYHAIGRFGQVDPLATEFPAWSPYVYANNNPFRYVDRTGLYAFTAQEETVVSWLDKIGTGLGRVAFGLGAIPSPDPLTKAGAVIAGCGAAACKLTSSVMRMAKAENSLEFTQGALGVAGSVIKIPGLKDQVSKKLSAALDISEKGVGMGLSGQSLEPDLINEEIDLQGLAPLDQRIGFSSAVQDKTYVSFP